jgi:O-antigen/teichoic acid export membrane protein
MGIVIKQSIGAAVYSYIGVALGVVSTLFIFPHYLSPAQMGLTMGVMLPLASILSIFAMLGTSNAAYYYAAHFKNDTVHQPRFLQFLMRMLLVGIALVVLAYIFCKPFFVANYQQKSALFIQYYWWVLPLIVFVSLYNFFEAFLKSQSDIIFANFCREVLLRLLTLACLGLFIAHIFTFHDFVEGFVLIWGILFLAILIYSFKKDWFSWSVNAQFNAVVSKKAIIQYSLVNVLSGAAWALASNIDSLMIAKYAGLESAGVFRLAVYICTVVQVPQRSITQIIITLLSEHWRNNAFEKINELYQKSSLQLIITGSFLVMLVMVNMDYFLQILPIEFSCSGSTKRVVILLCIARLVDMATSINGEIIQTSKHYQFNFYLIIGLLFFTIFTNYLLIPKYGIVGAAIAGMLTVIFFNIVKFIFVWYKFKFQPFTINSVIAISLAAIVGAIVYFIPYIINPYITIFCKSAMATLIFVVSLMALKISPEINQILFKAASFIRKK